MLCEFYQSDVEYQEVSLAQAYTRKGHEVTVVTSTLDDIFDFARGRKPSRNTESTCLENGVKIIRLPWRWHFTRSIRAHESIKHILELEKPEVIYVHDVMLNILECVNYVKSNPSTRFILDYHADYSNSGRNWLSRQILHRLWRRWFLNQARPYLNAIFPVVPGGFDFLRELYGVRDSEMTLLPLGVDASRLHTRKVATDRNQLRRNLGLSSDSFVIFTGGKLDPAKRTEELIEATKYIRDLDVELLIIGDSDDPHRIRFLRQSADEVGAKRVRFVGWQTTDQIEDWMLASDIAVFPASQSVMWQKAVACGLPMVVGDNGGQNPAYMNMGNIDVITGREICSRTLAMKIRALAEDRARRAAMGQYAKRVAHEILDWDHLAEKTLNWQAPRSETS